MLKTLRRKIVVGASTSRTVASMVGLGLGAWGALRGRRGSMQHLKSTFSVASKSPVVAGRPMNITIEPTNACNLGCPVCETGAGILGRETKHMAMEAYQTILDKVGPYTNTLMFYFMGEPFLNKRAYDMIRYAKDAGIKFVDTCTNGDFVDAEKIVASGLDRVSFQIGGLTQETHEVYRVNGQLDRVMRNLAETIRVRNERRSSMRIEVGFILMKHNEHEVLEFQRRMLALGADRAVIVDPCVRTVAQGHEFLPTDKAHWIYDEQEFDKGTLKMKVLPDNVCPWIYYSLSIHSNGNVVPCCRDPLGLEVMGNLVTEDLDAIWNGPRYVDFRRRIMQDQGGVEICRLCSSYPVSQIA